MNGFLENLFLISAVLGYMLGLALITYIFRPYKANFFLGLIVLFISTQLLFSWGSYSGYNSRPGVFPFWIFLTYHIIPPSVWLFVKYTFDQPFKLKRWHWLLFLPALIETGIHISFNLGMVNRQINLMNYQAWIWFIDYIPLAGLAITLGFFWLKYLQSRQRKEKKKEKSPLISQLKMVLFLSILSLICLFWILFTIIGWENFSIIEFLLVFLLLVFSFLIFLDSQPFTSFQKGRHVDSFLHYDDQKQLMRLDRILQEKQLYARPNLSLKELSAELHLPSRYISHLINRYHQKNFKEFINDYRIKAFIRKAQSPVDKHKTLLALAFEAGFNSKSTFNQVFKSQMGQSPTEFLS